MSDFDATEHEFVQAVHPLPACPDPDLLIAANQGVLPPDIERTIQKHLLHCGICKTLLNDLASLEPPNLTAKQHRHIRSEIPGMPVQNRMNRVILSAIAAAAILIAALWLIHRSHAPASAASTSSSAATTLTSINVPLTKLDPPAETATDAESHSKVSVGRPPAFELATAFAAYRQNKYRVAATDFSVLAQRYPESDIVFLYLGVSQLFLDQNEDALASLGRAEAIAKPERQEAASWYHAIAALRLQDTESKTLFEQLCSHHGSPYSDQACAVAKQLQPSATS